MSATVLAGIVAVFILFAAVIGGIAFFAYRKVLRRAKGIERGLKMVPLLIHLPPQSADTEVGSRDMREVMREKISQAEVLYELIAGTFQAGFKSSFYGQRHIALEMIATKGLIHYFVAVPVAMVSIIEQAIVSSYPGARLEEVEDHNIFNPQGKLSGTTGGELTLRTEAAYPIETYKTLERDPMETIINSMTKLQPGEGAAIQIMIRPSGTAWAKRASNLVAKKRQQPGSGIAFTASDLALAAVKTPEQQLNERQRFQPSKLEEELLQQVEEKMRHPGFETLVRVLVSAPNSGRAQVVMSDIANAFSLFEQEGSNGFKFIPAKDIQGLVTAFIFRFFPPELKSDILASQELATLFHLPDAQFTPTNQLERQQTKQVDGPVIQNTLGQLFGYNMFRGVKKEIRLSPTDRRRHTYIIGQTGTGKSTILENLAVQDMLAGNGFAFIDPHGDAAETLLSMVPKERAEDVIYFNPGDTEHPLGLNLFEFTDPAQKDFLIQESLNMLIKLYDPNGTGVIGPRFEQWYRNAALTLMADPDGATFMEIPKVFTDAEYLKHKFKYLKDPTVIDFWTKEMGQTSDYHKSEMLGYFVSKFGAFMQNEIMRNIIGQKTSAFNLRDVMDNKKILIVNLSKGAVGELNSKLLGMMFVIKFQAAAMSRANMPEAERKDFCLYVDEFQNFSTDSFASILSEARKYRLNLIVANQFVGQLTDEIRDAVFGNVGTILSFRTGPEDAEFLSKQFAPVFDARDLIGIPNFSAVMRLMLNNLPTQPFSITMLSPLGTEHPEMAMAVKQLSAAKFGVRREVVEADIFARLSGKKAAPSVPPPVAAPKPAASAPAPAITPAVAASAPVRAAAPVAVAAPGPVVAVTPAASASVAAVPVVSIPTQVAQSPVVPAAPAPIPAPAAAPVLPASTVPLVSTTAPVTIPVIAPAVPVAPASVGTSSTPTVLAPGAPPVSVHPTVSSVGTATSAPVTNTSQVSKPPPIAASQPIVAAAPSTVQPAPLGAPLVELNTPSVASTAPPATVNPMTQNALVSVQPAAVSVPPPPPPPPPPPIPTANQPAVAPAPSPIPVAPLNTSAVTPTITSTIQPASVAVVTNPFPAIQSNNVVNSTINLPTPVVALPAAPIASAAPNPINQLPISQAPINPPMVNTPVATTGDRVQQPPSPLMNPLAKPFSSSASSLTSVNPDATKKKMTAAEEHGTLSLSQLRAAAPKPKQNPDGRPGAVINMPLPGVRQNLRIEAHEADGSSPSVPTTVLYGGVAGYSGAVTKSPQATTPLSRQSSGRQLLIEANEADGKISVQPQTQPALATQAQSTQSAEPVPLSQPSSVPVLVQAPAPATPTVTQSSSPSSSVSVRPITPAPASVAQPSPPPEIKQQPISVTQLPVATDLKPPASSVTIKADLPALKPLLSQTTEPTGSSGSVSSPVVGTSSSSSVSPSTLSANPVTPVPIGAPPLPLAGYANPLPVAPYTSSASVDGIRMAPVAPVQSTTATEPELPKVIPTNAPGEANTVTDVPVVPSVQTVSSAGNTPANPPPSVPASSVLPSLVSPPAVPGLSAANTTSGASAAPPRAPQESSSISAPASSPAPPSAPLNSPVAPTAPTPSTAAPVPTSQPNLATQTPPAATAQAGAVAAGVNPRPTAAANPVSATQAGPTTTSTAEENVSPDWTEPSPARRAQPALSSTSANKDTEDDALEKPIVLEPLPDKFNPQEAINALLHTDMEDPTRKQTTGAVGQTPSSSAYDPATLQAAMQHNEELIAELMGAPEPPGTSSVSTAKPISSAPSSLIKLHPGSETSSIDSAQSSHKSGDSSELEKKAIAEAAARLDQPKFSSGGSFSANIKSIGSSGEAAGSLPPASQAPISKPPTDPSGAAPSPVVQKASTQAAPAQFSNSSAPQSAVGPLNSSSTALIPPKPATPAVSAASSLMPVAPATTPTPTPTISKSATASPEPTTPTDELVITPDGKVIQPAEPEPLKPPAPDTPVSKPMPSPQTSQPVLDLASNPVPKPEQPAPVTPPPGELAIGPDGKVIQSTEPATLATPPPPAPAPSQPPLDLTKPREQTVSSSTSPAEPPAPLGDSGPALPGKLVQPGAYKLPPPAPPLEPPSFEPKMHLREIKPIHNLDPSVSAALLLEQASAQTAPYPALDASGGLHEKFDGPLPASPSGFPSLDQKPDIAAALSMLDSIPGTLVGPSIVNPAVPEAKPRPVILPPDTTELEAQAILEAAARLDKPASPQNPSPEDVKKSEDAQEDSVASILQRSNAAPKPAVVLTAGSPLAKPTEKPVSAPIAPPVPKASVPSPPAKTTEPEVAKLVSNYAKNDIKQPDKTVAKPVHTNIDKPIIDSRSEKPKAPSPTTSAYQSKDSHGQDSRGRNGERRHNRPANPQQQGRKSEVREQPQNDQKITAAHSAIPPKHTDDRDKSQDKPLHQAPEHSTTQAQSKPSKPEPVKVEKIGNADLAPRPKVDHYHDSKTKSDDTSKSDDATDQSDSKPPIPNEEVKPEAAKIQVEKQSQPPGLLGSDSEAEEVLKKALGLSDSPADGDKKPAATKPAAKPGEVYIDEKGNVVQG